MATVAVVNDDEGAREVIARLVERDGHTARRVASAAEALALVADSPVDLAVLDLHSGGPAVNRTLLKEAREAAAGEGEEARPDLRAVLVGRSEGSGLLAWQGGADGFLVRPFHADDLVRAIDEALTRPDTERDAHRQAAVVAISTS